MRLEFHFCRLPKDMSATKRSMPRPCWKHSCSVVPEDSSGREWPMIAIVYEVWPSAAVGCRKGISSKIECGREGFLRHFLGRFKRVKPERKNRQSLPPANLKMI